MGTITLKNVRATSDLTVKVRLKDGGTAISWSSLSDIKAWIYSDVQKAIAGRCTVSIDQADSTLLLCDYSAFKPQYLGVNRIIVQCKNEGRTKTYDTPALNFVPFSTMDSRETPLSNPDDIEAHIEVQDVSSSILDEVIIAALNATERANEAAAAAEHMVDIHQGPPGPAGKAPYIDETTGNWFVWDDQTEQYVDSGNHAQGTTGTTPDITIGTVTTAEPGTPAAATMTGTPEAPVLNLTIPKGVAGDTPAFTVGEVTTGQPGTPVVVTITGTAAAPVLNFQIPQGIQGNAGSSVEYPFELVNNATTDDATKASTAAVAKGLKDGISQLEAIVHNLSGKFYEPVTSSSLLPEGDEKGYTFVGATAPFAIWYFDGTNWSDTGMVVTAIEGKPGADGVGLDDVETPTPYDGTAIFTLSNGDTITLDLNHDHPAYYSKVLGGAQPSGGFLPDVVYSLGTLTGTITFSLAAAVTGNVNHYFWMFDTSSTAPTITWPAGLTWAAGAAPTIAASKHYEISVLGGIAYYSEV